MIKVHKRLYVVEKISSTIVSVGLQFYLKNAGPTILFIA